MMKNKLFAFLLITLFLTNCEVRKDPVFTGVEQVRLVERSPRSLTFEIQLNFKNPNLLGGTFSSDDLTVFINNLELTSLESPLFEVPARDNFTMPILARLDASSFKGRELEIISSVLSIAGSQRIQLKLEGDLDYNILGYSSSYRLKYEENIELKRN